MANLKIEGTEDTPLIDFDIDAGKFEISGRSLPEDAVSFYNPVLEWLDGYYQGSPLGETVFDFKLEYFNTASSKLVLDLFMKLEEYATQGNSTKVNWYYFEDDEDMQEAGEEFAELVEVPFEFFEY